MDGRVVNGWKDLSTIQFTGKEMIMRILVNESTDQSDQHSLLVMKRFGDREGTKKKTEFICVSFKKKTNGKPLYWNITKWQIEE